jgi:hypothetical protein
VGWASGSGPRRENSNAAQVEDIIQRDVEAYMTQVMKEKGEQSAGSAAPPAGAQEVKLIQTTE